MKLKIADKLSKTSVCSSTLVIRESNVAKTKKKLDSVEKAIANYKSFSFSSELAWSGKGGQAEQSER